MYGIVQGHDVRGWVCCPRTALSLQMHTCTLALKREHHVPVRSLYGPCTVFLKQCFLNETILYSAPLPVTGGTVHGVDVGGSSRFTHVYSRGKRSVRADTPANIYTAYGIPTPNTCMGCPTVAYTVARESTPCVRSLRRRTRRLYSKAVYFCCTRWRSSGYRDA